VVVDRPVAERSGHIRRLDGLRLPPAAMHTQTERNGALDSGTDLSRRLGLAVSKRDRVGRGLNVLGTSLGGSWTGK
jgi:hypothetical protein